MSLSLGLYHKEDPFLLVNPGELSHGFPREVGQVDTPTSTCHTVGFAVGAWSWSSDIHTGSLPRMTEAQAEVCTREDSDVGR